MKLQSINPKLGIDFIKLDMQRNDLLVLLGDPISSDYEPDGRTRDFYKECVIEYSDDVCISIEAYAPSEVELFGRKVLNVPFAQLKDWFLSLDPEAKFSTASLISERLGVGLYAPHFRKDETMPVEAVIVFGEDYY